MKKLSEHFTYDEMTLSGTAVRKGIKNDLVDSNIPFDQAIFEFGRWVHVSWSSKPRRQALVASKQGAKTIYSQFVR
jgi:hypothetical protein